MLSHRPRPRILTVDQFFDEFEGVEERYELVDGVPLMMSGGTVQHARAAGNVFAALKQKLTGGPCEPFNSDMGLRLNLTNLRYPDVTIYCDPRDLDRAKDTEQGLRYPKAIFEVLSPSTQAFDRGGKVAEYQELPSLHAIVLIDVPRRSLEVHERVDEEWRRYTVADGASLVLRDPALTLTATEIFGG